MWQAFRLLVWGTLGVSLALQECTHGSGHTLQEHKHGSGCALHCAESSNAICQLMRQP